jgi:hypothetical protein
MGADIFATMSAFEELSRESAVGAATFLGQGQKAKKRDQSPWLPS